MKKLTVGILAHVDAGKTTLSEALMFGAGAIRSLGRVDKGDCYLDSNVLERKRGITIFSKCAYFDLPNTHVTLLDTPGHVDFSAETERTLSVLDVAILVISGSEGVQSHTKTLYRLLKAHRIPTFIFVNKMDMPGSDKDTCLAALKKLINENIVSFDSEPDMEEIAMCDENLLNHYLNGEEITDDQIMQLIKGFKLFPVVFGSALKLQNVERFMDVLDRYSYTPEYKDSFAARIFKINYDKDKNRLTFMKLTGGKIAGKDLINEEKVNQIRIYQGDKFVTVDEAVAGDVVAITGLTKTTAGDGLGESNSLPLLEPVLNFRVRFPNGEAPVTVLPYLKVLEEEDPTLNVDFNDITHEIDIKVMGLVQLEVLTSELMRRFNLAVSFDNGNIVYKETIADTVEGVGHFEPLRHYAEVHLLLEPGEPGTGIVIRDDVPQDMLSKNYIHQVTSILSTTRLRGVLTCSPITDIVITLKSGRSHLKHTEGGDFRQATLRAVRHGLMKATNVLLEPYYAYTLSLPTEYVGRAMTDMDKMGGSINLEAGENETTITGFVPVSSAKNYQAEVSAYTGGQGSISFALSGYRPCHNAEEVILEKDYDPERDTHRPASSVFCAHGAGFNVPWNEVENYMHLPSVLSPASEEDNLRFGAINYTASLDELDLAMGTEDVDEIIKKTFYSNSNKTNNIRRSVPKLSRSNGSSDKPYKGTETPVKYLDSYILVDGYNVIHAIKELDELRQISYDAARSALLDMLTSYQAIVRDELIVVFDAYNVKGHDTEVFDYENIHVVFTKEAETADAYIEKFTHENAKKHRIRVVTSDGLEQIIIRGQGALLTSSREFEEEMKRVKKDFAETYDNKLF